MYVQGRERYYRYRKEDNDQAIKLFRKALVIDPRFALAQAGLADAFSQRRGRSGGSLADQEAAVEAGRLAVELDPQLPEAHKALALTAVQRGHIREAVAENRRAVELHTAPASLAWRTSGSRCSCAGASTRRCPGCGDRSSAIPPILPTWVRV